MNHPDKTNFATPDIENVNVTDFDPMPSPEEIHLRVPLSGNATQTVMQSREALEKQLGREPTMDEIAQAARVAGAEIEETGVGAGAEAAFSFLSFFSFLSLAGRSLRSRSSRDW